MKLPIPFIKEKKSLKEYYLALLLDDEKTGSVILEETEGKIKIVGKHEEHLPHPIETLPLDDLITLVDRTISRAEEVLPPDIETHKTVFGVKENWVDKETKKIKHEYLSKLKKVCDALDLSPIGFMVINEAIANLLQSEEGAPLSAVLVELGHKTVHITLFRGGQIAESVNGPMEHSAPATVDSLLKKFTAPVLPSKIVLSHSKDTKNLAQHFMHHEWSKSLPFLHVPQVTMLPDDFDARAITYGAAQQMGFEVIGVEKFAIPEVGHTESEMQQQVEEKTFVVQDENVPEDGDNFGFVTNDDIAKHAIKETPHKVEHPPIHNPPPSATEEAIGHHKEMPHQHLPHHGEEAEKQNDQEASSRLLRREKKTSILLAGMIAKIKSLNLPSNIKLPEALKNNKRVKLGILIAGVIILLGIALSAFYFNGVKAEVILSVKPKEVTQEETITFSTSAGSDFSQKVIAAKSVSVSIDGEVSTNATGKKDTGEKAKGTVTIFNNATRETSLSSGTTITSSNDISFTLDKDVKVASASGDIFTGTKPGTAQVPVTAKEIGTEGNLPSNTRFTVGGNSSLAARNDSAFAGGTKKTITVVSRNDIAKLRSELPKSLEEKAREELASKNGSDETVLPVFVKTSVEDEDFDKDVDDEAKQVKLKATVVFEGMSYQNNDLENFDKSILKDNFSEDISFAEDSLKNEITDLTVEDGEVQGSLKITAGLLPVINTNDIIGKLKNVSEEEAQQTLETLPQVTESEIKYSPNLFFLSKLFPKLPNNINVTVKTH
jgi:hypothetical protein